jgi:DNA-binding transcriptional MerR regulator
VGGLLISQLAQRTGFSPSTLRFYEQAGLLPASARTPSGYRTYDEQTVDRLRFIARAKQLGLPLEEIRELAAAWDTGRCGPVQGRLATLVSTRIERVNAQIAELTRFAAELAEARDGLGRHTPDGPCDDECGCLTGVDPCPCR